MASTYNRNRAPAAGRRAPVTPLREASAPPIVPPIAAPVAPPFSPDIVPVLPPASLFEAPAPAAPLPVVQPSAPPPEAPAEAPSKTPSPLDEHGFDPSEFEWRPVARRPRSDGWTPEVQRRFIEALAYTGLVAAAAQEVDMSVTSCYRLRRAAGSESFARAWRAALVTAAERVVDLAFERAIEGDEIPVFHDGRRIGSRRRYNDRMAMFIMRACLPERFRHAHESTRSPNEAPPLREIPLPDAIEALAPVTPADPHLLTPPDALAAAVERERARAEVDELYPRDDREHYVRPRVEPEREAYDDEAYDHGANDPLDYRNWPRGDEATDDDDEEDDEIAEDAASDDDEYDEDDDFDDMDEDDPDDDDNREGGA